MGQAGPCWHVLAPHIAQASLTQCRAVLTLAGQRCDHLVSEALLPCKLLEQCCDFGAHLLGSA